MLAGSFDLKSSLLGICGTDFDAVMQIACYLDKHKRIVNKNPVKECKTTLCRYITHAHAKK